MIPTSDKRLRAIRQLSRSQSPRGQTSDGVGAQPNANTTTLSCASDEGDVIPLMNYYRERSTDRFDEMSIYTTESSKAEVAKGQMEPISPLNRCKIR